MVFRRLQWLDWQAHSARYLSSFFLYLPTVVWICHLSSYIFCENQEDCCWLLTTGGTRWPFWAKMKEPGAFDSAEECFEYAEPVNQNLICSICYAPFLEPITVSCQHTFCLHCFSNHLSSSTTQEQDPLRQKEPKCPLCNTAIDLHWTQSKIVSLMCEELSVYCSNRKKGCSWTGERQLMANHREKTCDYSVRSCTSAGCSFVGAELSKHLLICDFVLAECNHCGLELSRKELEVCLYLFGKQAMISSFPVPSSLPL